MSLNRCRFWYETDADRLDFTFYGGFPIDYPSGVDGLQATVSTNKSLDGIGSEIQLSQVPERPMSFSGYIVTQETGQEERKLHRMFAPMKKGRLYAETAEHEIFWLDCYSAAEPTVQGKRRFPRFLVQITASYPYWQADETKTLSFRMAGTGFTGTVSVESDVDAVYRALFSCSGGSCRNLTLTDQKTGLGIRYAGTLSDGDTLAVVISEFGRVFAGIGDQNVIGLVDADFKKLPVGSRMLKLTAEENSGTITAMITYREARAGV